MHAFHSLSNETLINISQYLTIQEMNTLSTLTNTLTKHFLGHKYVPFMLTSTNQEQAPCFSSVSIIPFIAQNLLRRNHLTPDEFSALSSGVRQRFICSHENQGTFQGTLDALKQHLNHFTETCPQKNAQIATILSCFCSKITRLDWRKYPDYNIVVPISGFVDEHGFTPLQLTMLYRYFKMFPYIQALTLRGYHIQEWSASVNELRGQKFFISECEMHLIYSVYTNMHYSGFFVKDPPNMPLSHTWRSFSCYHAQSGCSGAVTIKPSFSYHKEITPDQFMKSSYVGKTNIIFNQFIQLALEPKDSKLFEDYVVFGSDLNDLKIFIHHVSKDVKYCNQAVIEFTQTKEHFLL